MMLAEWASVLNRFRSMSQIEQLVWLSQLVYLISMYARETYEVGTVEVSNGSALRAFNELIHRVAIFQKKVAEGSVEGMPEDTFFFLIADELVRLNVPLDSFVKMLP